MITHVQPENVKTNTVELGYKTNSTGPSIYVFFRYSRESARDSASFVSQKSATPSF